MKNILLVIVALVLIVGIGSAQSSYVVKSSTANYNSRIDTVTITSVGGFSVGAFTRMSLVTYTDSASIKIYVDYRVKGNSAWTLKDSVSVSATSATYSSWVLRDNATEVVSGVWVDYRFRFAFQASGNPAQASTKKYSANLYYR